MDGSEDHISPDSGSDEEIVLIANSWNQDLSSGMTVQDSHDSA
jgi:hypothetical protein